MVNSVRECCGCGMGDCDGGDGGGGGGVCLTSPNDRGRRAGVSVSGVQFVVHSQDNRASPVTAALLNNHSCTNNSHPDIFTKLQDQETNSLGLDRLQQRCSGGKDVVKGAVGEEEEKDQRNANSDENGDCERSLSGGVSCDGAGSNRSRVGDSRSSSSPSFIIRGGGIGPGIRRHSAEENTNGSVGVGVLGRHVWSHQSIVGSLSREGLFPTPNEHHPALVRPLVALGDLSVTHPELPTRLHHLVALLTANPSACCRNSNTSSRPAVAGVSNNGRSGGGGSLSASDAALLSALARLPLPQAGVPATLRQPFPQTAAAVGGTPNSTGGCASGPVSSVASTPDSVITPRWPSVSSLASNAEYDQTPAHSFPSRASSFTSFVSSLPDDEVSQEPATDEEDQVVPEESSTMAAADLVAPHPQYEHHAYHIYYGGMKSVGRGEGGSLQPRLTRELAMSPDYTRPKRLDLLLDMPPVPREASLKHAWNAEDRSLNIFVKEDDKMTFHRHPVAQSTDCIRGKVGYTRGLHLWEIHWSTRQRGTHAVVGVATDEAPLHSQGYQSLVGSNDQSWGWDLGRNKLYHNAKQGNSGITYPSLLNNDETFVVPDKFYVVLDMDEGTLAFVVEGQYLGVAFRGLKGKKLFPIVSAVWGHCEITIRYIGGLDPEPLPLMDLCRRVIRQAVGKQRLTRLGELNLPQSVTQYLLYHDRR
ncbi:uncharacterized protein gus isoform X1 [Palaemon carinicauda]|uniref:uncharacterized protein gus isoform X1 n=1 Tax=Palaemon carinicauda TaxID=392227 RepID=UPI0035B68C85